MALIGHIVQRKLVTRWCGSCAAALLNLVVSLWRALMMQDYMRCHSQEAGGLVGLDESWIQARGRLSNS